MTEVTVFVDQGRVCCITVPEGHLPVRIVDTMLGVDGWFEEGHSDNVEAVLYGEEDA